MISFEKFKEMASGRHAIIMRAKQDTEFLRQPVEKDFKADVSLMKAYQLFRTGRWETTDFIVSPDEADKVNSFLKQEKKADEGKGKKKVKTK